MSGISNKYSQQTHRTENSKPVQTVETAGSLAMNKSYFNPFAIDTYDSFSTNNPFAVNYADYAAAGGETVACATGFWGDIAMLSNMSGAGCVSAGASSCGSAGGGCSAGGGGVFC